MYDKNGKVITILALSVYLKSVIAEEKVMNIICRVNRLWTVALPTMLLAATFQYAHQLNVIINSIGDMGFKKTISIIFISFIAIWSLLYLGSVFFVRVLKWIWCGRTITETEKSSIQNDQELEERTKNSIEYHDEKEQARLFQLDLQDEPIANISEKEHQESK
ncbi:uncharacterized protein METZ01_LOCUS102460 [marine metagenome]|uniref:Uncharacterized protein n=1 Tax=marine metagenome TaxID=408172 RepID=A0A381WAM4_9ZZZZ